LNNYYLYDQDNITVEFMTDGNGTAQTVYTHGPNTDEPLALERNNQYAYYHTDGLGSIVSLTDGARNVLQTYAYDSFGGITPTTAFRNTFTYTGREYDEETGLYFYRARYYDPKLGRFLNPDPIGFEGGDTNLYAYVGNNPVNRTDPQGTMGFIPKGPGKDPAYSNGTHCNGWWRQVEWSRTFNALCRCYWLCMPCDSAIIWNGNPYSLPSTGGTVTNRWGNITSGDWCSCPKPGSESCPGKKWECGRGLE
jgi:RHS repeat-associated protein